MRVLSRSVHLLSVSVLLCTLVATLPVVPIPRPTLPDHGGAVPTGIIVRPRLALLTRAATVRPQRAPNALMGPGTHRSLTAQHSQAWHRQQVLVANDTQNDSGSFSGGGTASGIPLRFTGGTMDTPAQAYGFYVNL